MFKWKIPPLAEGEVLDTICLQFTMLPFHPSRPHIIVCVFIVGALFDKIGLMKTVHSWSVETTSSIPNLPNPLDKGSPSSQITELMSQWTAQFFAQDCKKLRNVSKSFALLTSSQLI